MVLAETDKWIKKLNADVIPLVESVAKKRKLKVIDLQYRLDECSRTIDMLEHHKGNA